MQSHKRKVTSEAAIQILKEHGTIIIIEEAEKTADFLYTFGYLALKTIFKKRLLLNSEKLDDSTPSKVV